MKSYIVSQVTLYTYVHFNVMYIHMCKVFLDKLSLTQIVTIETMLGEEKEQADCAQNGDCEEYFLPFDRLTLLCCERLAVIQYGVKFNGSQHIT